MTSCLEKGASGSSIALPLRFNLAGSAWECHIVHGWLDLVHAVCQRTGSHLIPLSCNQAGLFWTFFWFPFSLTPCVTSLPLARTCTPTRLHTRLHARACHFWFPLIELDDPVAPWRGLYSDPQGGAATIHEAMQERRRGLGAVDQTQRSANGWRLTASSCRMCRLVVQTHATPHAPPPPPPPPPL